MAPAHPHVVLHQPLGLRRSRPADQRSWTRPGARATRARPLGASPLGPPGGSGHHATLPATVAGFLFKTRTQAAVLAGAPFLFDTTSSCCQ